MADPERRDWLIAQLRALEAHAQALDGEPLPYAEHVALCLGFEPPRHDDAGFREALAAVDALLPGRRAACTSGSRPGIGASRSRSIGCPPSSTGWSARFRDRARRDFGLPDGEDLRVSLVTGQPWSGYNWYDGGRRSRVDINTDLPVRAPDLVTTVAHETYPGHHLEHAWKEADLVDAAGPARGLDAADQHARVPDQRGPGRSRDLVRRSARRASGPPARAVRASRAGGRGRSGRSARDGGASRGPGRTATPPGGEPWQRRPPATRRRRVPRRGPGLSAGRRRVRAEGGRQAARVHRAPPLADVRLRLRRGRGARSVGGWRRPRRPSGSRGSAASSTNRSRRVGSSRSWADRRPSGSAGRPATTSRTRPSRRRGSPA